MEYRCPKHDQIFETLTDHRKPGSLAADNFQRHPVNGHPDCPLCKEEMRTAGKSQTPNEGRTFRKVA